MNPFSSLTSFLSYVIPYESWYNIDFKFQIPNNEADFTGWMSFLSSYLTEEISPNADGFSENT